jgi:phosphatidylserine decarboxylase
MKKIFILLILLLFAVTVHATILISDQPTVKQLKELVNHNPILRQDILSTLNNQPKDSIWYHASLNDLYSFFNHWLAWIPQPVNIDPKSKYVKDTVADFPPGQFNQLINSTPYLRANHTFMVWLGEFLDAAAISFQSPASAKYLNEWMALPAVHIQDFIVPKNGYSSFNAFFLRVLKPGSRPIAFAEKADAITSPADCSYDLPITLLPDRFMDVKGDHLFPTALLNKSVYASYFELDGISVVCHLNITDYHHFHSPVDGKIVAAGITAGLYNFDSDFYKHIAQHRRAYFVFKTKYGYVGMVTVGQWIVNSILIQRHVGDIVHKGDELGHFNLGGSAIVLLFQPNGIQFTQKVLHSSTNFNTKRLGQFSGPWIPMGENIGYLTHIAP